MLSYGSLDQIRVNNVKMQRGSKDKIGFPVQQPRARPAEKEGGIVVLDLYDYPMEMYRIVRDCETYIPLNRDPVIKYKKDLYRVL